MIKVSVPNIEREKRHYFSPSFFLLSVSVCDVCNVGKKLKIVGSISRSIEDPSPTRSFVKIQRYSCHFLLFPSHRNLELRRHLRVQTLQSLIRHHSVQLSRSAHSFLYMSTRLKCPKSSKFSSPESSDSSDSFAIFFQKFPLSRIACNLIVLAPKTTENFLK